MELAHDGQIVVSEATAVLLRDRADLLPLGEHRLGGIGGWTAIYQVVADGLPAQFPPLRGLRSAVGNLREDPSTFVGREPLFAARRMDSIVTKPSVTPSTGRSICCRPTNRNCCASRRYSPAGSASTASLRSSGTTAMSMRSACSTRSSASSS